jgi:predicted transcriptional regulator
MMNKAKSDALSMIQTMPDDVTWEQLVYRLYVRAMVEQGMAEIEAGLGIPHEQVNREVAEWLSSSGRRPHVPTSETSTTESPAIQS